MSARSVFVGSVRFARGTGRSYAYYSIWRSRRACHRHNGTADMLYTRPAGAGLVQMSMTFHCCDPVHSNTCPISGCYRYHSKASATHDYNRRIDVWQTPIPSAAGVGVTVSSYTHISAFLVRMPQRVSQHIKQFTKAVVKTALAGVCISHLSGAGCT